MPDQPDSTPPPVALPAIVDPDTWEQTQGFRETLLARFTDPEANRCLRVLGNLLYDMALEFERHWPHAPEGEVPTDLRAVVGDLRHAQGFLATIATGPEHFGLTLREVQLCRLAGRKALAVEKIADALEAKLGERPEETPGVLP